jgi:hypothetical protein
MEYLADQLPFGTFVRGKNWGQKKGNPVDTDQLSAIPQPSISSILRLEKGHQIRRGYPIDNVIVVPQCSIPFLAGFSRLSALIYCRVYQTPCCL